MDLIDNSGEGLLYSMDLRLSHIYIYTNLFIDTSMYKSFDFGDYYKAYIPSTYWPRAVKSNLANHFSLVYRQGRDVDILYFCTSSLNSTIGRIGGYTALMWMVLGSLLGDYSVHKFQASLHRNLYHCTEDGPNGPQSESAENSKRTLEKTITTDLRFVYHYYEYYATWLAQTFLSCCCKNQDWYKKRADRL